MRDKPTLRASIAARIAERPDDVFLPREFRDLGGEDQVSRALRDLTRDGALLRLGYGVYGRAQTSRLSGRPILAASGGLMGAARQALDKLGVPWEQTAFQRAYNEGRSTPPYASGDALPAACATWTRNFALSGDSAREHLEVQAHFRLPDVTLVTKDLHVVRAIKAIAALDASPYSLIFGGGTALARAHRLVRRMSEDVDFKIVPLPAETANAERSATLPTRCCGASGGWLCLRPSQPRRH